MRRPGLGWHPRVMSAPDPDALFEIASTQAGYFTAAQAREAGFSKQLLYDSLKTGRFLRVMRAIYRLKHYPYEAHDELVIAWLWSDRSGVFSHQTALALHQLSDVFPSRNYLTVPPAIARTRRAPPQSLIVRPGVIPVADRTWYGAVLVTRVKRTIEDCIDSLIDRLLIEQAISEGSELGRISPDEAKALSERLERTWT